MDVSSDINGTIDLHCGTTQLAPVAIPSELIVQRMTPALDIRAGFSSMLALPLGHAVHAYTRQGNWLLFTDFQITGRYARKGETITFKVSEELKWPDYAIGMRGRHSFANDGADVEPTVARLSPGINEVQAPCDGMIYVQNRNDSVAGRIVIEGGLPVPTYVAGITNRHEFLEQLSQWPESPIITLVGRRVFCDIQARHFRELILDQNLETVIRTWDAAIELTDRLHGFQRGGASEFAISGHFLHIVNPDTGAGYASANHRRLTFQVDTGACESLVRGSRHSLRVLTHELGHTYQPELLRWNSNIVERGGDASGMYAYEMLTGSNFLDTAETRQKLAEFQRTPIQERDFEAISDPDNRWLQVLMFDQLRRGFGPFFYASMLSSARRERFAGTEIPSTLDEFALRCAATANRNLIPFFDNWGVKLSESILSTIGKFEPLHNEIWLNCDRLSDALEWIVPDPAQTAIALTDSSNHIRHL